MVDWIWKKKNYHDCTLWLLNDSVNVWIYNIQQLLYELWGGDQQTQNMKDLLK